MVSNTSTGSAVAMTSAVTLYVKGCKFMGVGGGYSSLFRQVYFLGLGYRIFNGYLVPNQLKILTIFITCKVIIPEELVQLVSILGSILFKA